MKKFISLKTAALTAAVMMLTACGGDNDNGLLTPSSAPTPMPTVMPTPMPTVMPTPMPTVTPTAGVDVSLTVLGMLVNTNDGFTGINAMKLKGIAAGSNYTFNGRVWDAGTEANTESAGTMPGPADGGEGFAAARDDIIDRVRIHAGVLATEMPSSILQEVHRFDQPAVRVNLAVSESTASAGGLDLTFTLVNLTNAQPISPALVLLHKEGFSAFMDGMPASQALEMMAEGGSTAELETIAGSASEYLIHDVTRMNSDPAPIGPQGTSTVVLTLTGEQVADLASNE